jgi:hypothetical protein
MKIEFKNLQDKFQVIEHVIRKSNPQYFDDPHDNNEYFYLQARLLLKNFDDNSLNFSVSYYGKENNFMGLDTADDIFVTKSQDKSVAISTPLDIPEQAEHVIVRFIFEDEVNADNNFYDISFKISLAIFIAWLGLSLTKSFISFFG